MTELLDSYLNRECGKNKMPQMRWAYQIFGNHYNPHDRKLEHDSYHILECAYIHEECDRQTVDLYFGQQAELLWWGQHHFPKGCIITKEAFEDVVYKADRILSEKPVDPLLVREFEYYVMLYHICFKWRDNDGNGDFYELCKKEGLDFKAVPAIYYKK